jgi:hypothetical protein
VRIGGSAMGTWRFVAVEVEIGEGATTCSTMAGSTMAADFVARSIVASPAIVRRAMGSGLISRSVIADRI